MNRTKQRVWLLATALFAIIIITLALPPMVLHPWNLIPELDGDGGKNIFTYLYHAVYEKGAWFRGMNYPYGEHIVYADGQPLLSVTLGYFKISVGEALTVMEWLIVLSYILAIVYVFKILSHFGVQPFIAMLFAGLIGIYSPQLLRITGHYAMAYSCVVPMLFLWTIKYNITPRWKYAVYIFILGGFVTFLHPYFSAIILIWVLSYSIGCFIFIKAKFIDNVKHVFPLLISVTTLFAYIGLLMKLTDPVKDRPIVPFGALNACTDFSDILTSFCSPVWKSVMACVPSLVLHQGGEGFCYPGLAIIIVVLYSLARGIIFAVKKKKTNYIFNDGVYAPVWLFIGFAALLFSMGVPFVWHMEWLLDYVSFFHQFRSLGRFSWIFYYMVTIYGVVVINKWYVTCLQKKKTVAAYSILISVMALWCFEASGYIMFLRKKLNDAADNVVAVSPNGNQNLPADLRAHHYAPGDFQALLILQFFEIGSEKLWLGNDYITITGVYTALQMQLPMIDAMMSRTSWSVAEKQIKILAGPYVHKPILDDIKSNKPFLILQRDIDSLNADEKYLFKASDFIGHFQNCYAYACYPARLRENDKKNADSINAIVPYLKPGKDSCVTYTGDWYVNHFDTGHAKAKFFSDGAVAQIMQRETVIAQIPVDPHGVSKNYEFSCWFLLGREDYKSPSFRLELQNTSGNIINTVNVLTGQSTDNEGLWFRSEACFTIPGNCRSIKCILVNDHNTYKIMDEMMLRPVDALIISKAADGSVMVNNHLFRTTAGKK